MSTRLRIPTVKPGPPRHPDGGYAVCPTCGGALVEGEPCAVLEDGRSAHALCWFSGEGLPVLAGLARALEATRGELGELRGELEGRGLRARARRALERLRGSR